MNKLIIADSCCDLTDDMKANINVKLAPLKITVPRDGGAFDAYVDDESINIMSLLASLKATKGVTSTACPSPEEYATYMRSCDECYVVTLSSKLSGSNNAAEVAKAIVLDENPNAKIHVFDSLSASVGETVIVLKINEMLQAGAAFEDIVSEVNAFIKEKYTFFVLDNLGTLVKNGRMSKVTGLVASMLSIKPVMRGDENGEIQLYEKCRGSEAAMKRLAEIITEKVNGRNIRLLISECNCPERALKLKAQVEAICKSLFDIVIVKMKGLSSTYANDGGIIVSF